MSRWSLLIFRSVGQRSRSKVAFYANLRKWWKCLFSLFYFIERLSQTENLWGPSAITQSTGRLPADLGNWEFLFSYPLELLPKVCRLFLRHLRHKKSTGCVGPQFPCWATDKGKTRWGTICQGPIIQENKRVGGVWDESRKGLLLYAMYKIQQWHLFSTLKWCFLYLNLGHL